MALTVFEEGPASLDPQKALYIPVGAASPLWFMFAGVASAGVAYWWMTRWADRTNLEAFLVAPRPAPAAEVVASEPIVAVVETVEATEDAAVQATAASVEAAAEAVETVEQALSPDAEPTTDASPKTRTKIRPAGEPPSEA